MSSRFKIKKITKFQDFINDPTLSELPTSDLCLTSDDAILQFEYIEDEDEVKEKTIVKPGIFTLTKTQAGIKLEKTEMRIDHLLTSVINTSTIKGQFQQFFSKLHVYAKRGIETKKRSILYYSAPGNGKSSSIRQTITELIAEDPGTVALIWPTSEIQAEHVSRFFSFYSEYDAACTRVILVIEEIGGSEEEGHGRRNEVSSGLLNFLDGINVTFRLPTFIVATTNYPQNLLKELADRPGRFDRLIELEAPSYEEKIKLLEFFEKRPLTDEEKNALLLKGSENLSIAHLSEIGVRAELEDMTFAEVIKQMIAHKERFSKGFESKKSVRMGFGRDED